MSVRRWIVDVEIPIWLGLLGVMLWGTLYVQITPARNLTELVLLWLIGWTLNRWWIRRDVARRPNRIDKTTTDVVAEINGVVERFWSPSEHDSDKGK